MDSAAILNCVESVTKKWTKQRKAEERGRNQASRRRALTYSSRVCITDVARRIMKDVYLRVSDNRALPAAARQMYYAARPLILAETGETSLDSNYFTQKILPGYIAEHPEAESWDIVFDARGHIQEPHTRVITPLGTLDVRQYLAKIRGHRVPDAASLFTLDAKARRFPTCGAENRFSAVLFIEKEGFMPLFEKVHLAEKWDIAIMSTKGMPVTACRMLADELCGTAGIPLFVLHDFDKSGFSILGTLRGVEKFDSNYNLIQPRYEYKHEFDVIDLGVRLDDVQAYKLESEPVSYGKSNPCSNLEENGATADEIRFLVNGCGYQGTYCGSRVELNAFTSRDLVAWIETKLRNQKVKKLIPDQETLETAYRRALQIASISARIEEVLEEVENATEEVTIPKNLSSQIRKRLKTAPTQSWDEVLFSLAEEAEE
jgi:hypothetical protein